MNCSCKKCNYYNDLLNPKPKNNEEHDLYKLVGDLIKHYRSNNMLLGTHIIQPIITKTNELKIVEIPITNAQTPKQSKRRGTSKASREPRSSKKSAKR